MDFDIATHRIAEDLGVLSPATTLERPLDVRRNVRNGRWQRLGRCVLTQSGPVTRDQLMWCAILSPPGVAALARESALRSAGVKGVKGSSLVVVTPHGQRPMPIAGVSYAQTRHLTTVDLEPRSRPLRTTVARAVVDAASCAGAERARTLLAMTVQQRRVDPADVRHVLTRLAPVRQEVLLRLTLDDVEGGAHSLPELNFARLVRQAGLPVPTRQVLRQRPDGRWYVDVAWEEFGLVTEIDGAHHRDAEQWEADILRQDELMIGGDRVLRLLSWWVRDRPSLVVDLLRRALIAGGWQP